VLLKMWLGALEVLARNDRQSRVVFQTTSKLFSKVIVEFEFTESRRVFHTALMQCSRRFAQDMSLILRLRCLLLLSFTCKVRMYTLVTPTFRQA
jgi:hypothetical protein